MEIIETKRCILRDATLGDKEDLFDCYKRDIVVKFLPFNKHKNIKETERFIKMFFLNNYRKGKIGHFVIVLKSTNKVIGNIGFNNIKHDSKEGEIGICINPDYWGDNLSLELGSAIVNYGFQKLNLEKIIAVTFEDNTYSQKPLIRLGFTYKESFKKNIKKIPLDYVNCHKFEIKRDSFMLQK